MRYEDWIKPVLEFMRLKESHVDDRLVDLFVQILKLRFEVKNVEHGGNNVAVYTNSYTFEMEWSSNPDTGYNTPMGELTSWRFFVYDNGRKVAVWDRPVSDGPIDRDVMRSIVSYLVGKASGDGTARPPARKPAPRKK